MGDVTLLLEAARQGETLAVGRIFELLYPQLKRIAHAKLSFRDDRLLMDTGVLVNEAYLRLLSKERLSANDRGHFLAYAAQVMRNVVVDTVREHQAERRGGGLQAFVTLDTQALNLAAPSGEEEILNVHEALEQLGRIDDRLVKVVEMRYFVGLSNQEIADRISVSESTTTHPTPASTAAVSSGRDLLLPCSASRSAGNPACRATANSPPLATSSDRPSSATQRATSLHRKALAA